MATKTRWIKVSVSYREGETLNEWNAVELGNTDMVQEIADPSRPALSDVVRALGRIVEDAASELVERGERLSPPAVADKSPALV